MTPPALVAVAPSVLLCDYCGTRTAEFAIPGADDVLCAPCVGHENEHPAGYAVPLTAELAGARVAYELANPA